MIFIIYILGGIMIAILIGLVIYFAILKTHEKEDPENQPLIINLMPQYSEGYGLGVVDDLIFGDKRTGVKFLPRDMNYIKLRRTREKPKPQLVFYEKEKLIPLSNSSRREILIGLPPNEEDIPDKMKKTIIGKALMNVLKDLNNGKEEDDILRLRLKNQRKILDKTEGLEIVQDYMSLEEEKDKQMIKGIMREEKKFGTTGTTNPIH